MVDLLDDLSVDLSVDEWVDLKDVVSVVLLAAVMANKSDG